MIARNAFDMPLLLKDTAGRNIRLTAILRSLCHLDTPGDKWNLGDTESPYIVTYAPVPNRFEWLPGAPQLPVRFDANGRRIHHSLEPFVAPVWTNNEYDIIHCIATEIARTGRKEHHDMLRWTARHTIEVDFLAYHDDRWHHRATPAHSQRHHTTGAYPSHFWTQGLLQYYLLTGDRDAYEVALALGDKVIENLDCPDVHPMSFDREFGWGLLSLVCLVEATGEERFRAECDRVVDFLQRYDRAAFSGAVNLSAGDATKTLERQMIDNAFGYTCMVEAIDRYQHVTGREDTAAWLEILLRQLKDAAWQSIDEGSIPGGLVKFMLAIGYERTRDPDFLRAGLVCLEYSLQHGISGQGSAKPSAMAYRALCRFLGHADRAGQLAQFELATLRERQGV